jgi:hypothetical protein
LQNSQTALVVVDFDLATRQALGENALGPTELVPV